jgi:probable F420-dependent oxidoreductase
VSERPFRFGVEMMGPFDGRTWADSARELEALGYSTLFAPDHFDEGYGPITAMATAAAATTTLKVATAVFAADFRHPAVVARELASLDLLSEGRLEVGLGAGYNVDDYAWSGIPMDRPGVRVGRLIEHVAVLRGLFADGPFSYDGEHYKISGLDGTPKPFRPGGPPIFVAGGGRRMLSFAARHADIVGVNPSLPSSAARAEAAADALPERIDEKIAWMREAAGARFDELEIHAWVQHVAVGSGPVPEELRASPFALVGSEEEIVEQLGEARARWGYTYYTIQQPAARELANVVARLAR